MASHKASQLRELIGSALTSRMAAAGLHFEGSPDLHDFDDPSYYMSMPIARDRQAVVNLARIGKGASPLEKTRWLDQQLSHLQCPYPIKHIEFTYTGDAVVEFVSEAALKKALARGPLKWEALDVPTRPVAEEDIRHLSWVLVSGVPLELYPFVRQALQEYGDVKGECPPHQGYGHKPGMLKYYFQPNKQKRLPPTIQFIRPERPNGYPPTTVKVFSPSGPLAPKCADFGKEHSPHCCPECFRRKQGHAGGG